MRISFIWYCILWICSYAWSWAQQQQQQTPEKQDIVIFGVDLEKTDFKQNLRIVDAYNKDQAYIGGGGGSAGNNAEAGKANFIITYRKGDFQNIEGIISEYRGQSFGFKKKDPAGGIQETNSIFGTSPVNNQIYSISLFPYKLAKEAIQPANQNTEPIPQGFFVSRGNSNTNGGGGVGDKSYIFRFWDRYKKPAAAGAPAANPQNPNPTGIELDMDNKNVSDDKINALVAVDTNKVLAVGKVLKVFDGRKNKWKNYVDSAKDPATKSSKIKKDWELNGIATLRKKPGQPDTAYIVGQKGVFIRVPFQVCLKATQQPPAAATEDSIKIDTALILNNFCKDCKPNNNCANCTGCVSKPDVGQGLPCNGGDTDLTAVAVFKDTVWVTSNKGTIYKSTDSGRTFKKETLEKGKVLSYNGTNNTTIRVETEVDPSKNKAFYSISFPNANGGYAAGEPQDNKIPLIYENVCDLEGKIPRNLPCCDPQKPLPKVKSSNCKWQPSPALSNRYNALSYPTWYGTSFLNTDLGWLVGSSGALIRYAPDFDMSCALNDIEELRNIQNVNIYDYREQGGAKKTKLPPNQYYGGEREVSLLNMGTAEVAVCSRDDQPAIPTLESVDKIIDYNDDVVPQKLQKYCGEQSPNFNYTSDPKDCRQVIDPPPNNQNNNKCERIPPKTYKPATYVRVHNFGRALIGTEWELVNRPANLYFFLPRAGKQLAMQNNNNIRNPNDLTKNRLLSPSYDPLKEEQTSADPVSKFCTDTTHVRIRTKINGKEQHALCYDTLLKSRYEHRTEKDTGYPIPQMNTHLTANVIVNNGVGTGGGTTNHKEVLPDTVRGGFWGRQSSNNQGKRVPYTIGVGVLAPNFSLSPMITPLVFALGHSRTTFDTLFVVQPGLVPYLYAQGENNTSFGNRSKYLREHSNAYPEMQDSFHIVTNAAYKIYMKNAPAPYSLKIDNLNGKSGQNGENGKVEDTPILRRFNKYREGTFNRPTLNITGKWLYTNSAKSSLDTIVVRGIGPCMDMKMEKNAGTTGTAAATNNRNLKVDENHCYNDSTFLVMRRDPLYYKITTQDKKSVSYKDFPDTNNKDYNSPANKVTHLLFEANGKPKVNIFELETDTRYKFKLGGAYQKKPKDAPQNSGTGTGKPNYEKEDYHKERFHIRLYKKEKEDPGKQDQDDTIKFKGSQTKKAWDSLHIENYDTGGKTCPDPRAANTQVATTGTNDQLYNGITPLYVQTVLRKSNYWDKPRYDTITYEVTGYHNFKQPQGSKERTRRFATIIVEQEAAQLFLLRQGMASATNPGFDPSVPKDADEKIDLHYYQDSSEKKRFSRDSVHIKASVKWHIKTGRQQDPKKPNNGPYGKGFGVWWDTISAPPMAIYKRGAHKPQNDKDSIPKYKGDGLKDIPDGIDCDTLGNAVWSIKTNNAAAQAGSAQSEHTVFPKIIFRAIQSNMTDNVREDSIQICALEDFVCKTVKIRQDTPHLSYSYQLNPLRKRMTKDTALYFVHKKYCDKYAPFTKDSIRVRLLNGGMWVIDSMGCYDWDKGFKQRQKNDHKQQAQNSNDKDSIPLFSHPPGTPDPKANNFSYSTDTTIVFWTPQENMTNHRRHCVDSICAVAPEVEESLRNKAQQQQPSAQLHQPQAECKNKKNKYCLPIRFVQDTPLIVVDQEPAVLDYYRNARGTIRIGANENYQLLLPDFVKIVACPNPQDRQPTLINPIEQVDQSQINPNVKPINGSGQDAVCCTVNANAQQPQQQAAQPAICNNNQSQGPCNSSAQTTASAGSSGSSSQQLDKSTCQTHAASDLKYNEFTNCLLDKKQVSKDTAKHDFIETNMKHLADGTMGIETRQYCFEVRRLYDNDAVIQKKGDGNKNFDLKIYIPKTKDSVKRIAKMIQQPPVFNLSNNEGTAGIGTKSKHVFLSRRAGAGVGTVKLNTNTHWQISGYDANLFEFSPNQGTNRKSQQISVKAKHDNEFDNAIYDTAVFYPTDICQTDRDKFRDTVFIKQDSFWIHVTLRKDKDPKYPSIETINKFPHYVVPAPENDYLRFDVEANAPWVAASYKGVNKTLAWDIINPNPSGFSANDVGLLGLNAFSLPDFLVGRHDSVMLFLLDKAGVRHYRHTIKYYQKPYDFKEENIVVFPNPVKSRLYIKSINSQLFKTGNIFIYALDGSLIASRTYANGVIDFDFDTLPQGVYILKIYDGKVFVTKKIIKG